MKVLRELVARNATDVKLTCKLDNLNESTLAKIAEDVLEEGLPEVIVQINVPHSFTCTPIYEFGTTEPVELARAYHNSNSLSY